MLFMPIDTVSLPSYSSKFLQGAYPYRGCLCGCGCIGSLTGVLLTGLIAAGMLNLLPDSTFPWLVQVLAPLILLTLPSLYILKLGINAYVRGEPLLGETFPQRPSIPSRGDEGKMSVHDDHSLMISYQEGISASHSSLALTEAEQRDLEHCEKVATLLSTRF